MRREVAGRQDECTDQVEAVKLQVMGLRRDLAWFRLVLEKMHPEICKGVEEGGEKP